MVTEPSKEADEKNSFVKSVCSSVCVIATYLPEVFFCVDFPSIRHPYFCIVGM